MVVVRGEVVKVVERVDKVWTKEMTMDRIQNED